MTVAEVTRVGKKRTFVLPPDFYPSENKFYINKIGNSIVLIPYHDSWKSLFESLTEFSDDFMDDREQPKEQIRESIFS